MTTLSQLASWLNDQGFRTRNMHKIPDAQGNPVAGQRLFTVASLRGILHNPFYMGKVRHGKGLLSGAHEAIVSEDLYHELQAALKLNSGRSRTLQPRLEREYLLKGLIRCAHCMMPMWARPAPMDTDTTGSNWDPEVLGTAWTGAERYFAM
jgi:hypothetical protein